MQEYVRVLDHTPNSHSVQISARTPVKLGGFVGIHQSLQRNDGTVLWSMDPLLSGDYVNSDRCLVTPATYMQGTIEELCFFFVVRAEIL
jgi:hypothetical protein